MGESDAFPWSDASVPIWALVSGFPSAQRRKLVIVTGYIDESESDGVFAMAGFVAPAEEWAAFSDAWDAALAAPPKAKTLFKAREVMRKRPGGAFWGMSDNQRNEKLDALYSVIDAHAAYASIRLST